MTRVTALLAVVLLLISGCMPVSKAQSVVEANTPAAEVVRAAPAAQPKLWIDMSMGPQVLGWYNDLAQPVDIARVEHVSLVDLLDQVKSARRLVVFKNVADAEALVPRLADKMDIIGYNLEHGPTNRPDEQADPVGSVMRMRELADEYGMELALGPDRAFALNDGVAMAPYVDMFILQVQRVQTEPDVVRAFVVPLVQELRRANPELQISVQVRTEGDVKAIADLIGSMESSLDGVSILTSEETVDIAEALVAELRPPAPLLPGSPQDEQPDATQPALELHAVVLPTANPSPRKAIPTATPALAVAAPTGADNAGSAPAWLFAAALASMGVVISALLATMWVYTVQNTRKR